LESILSTQKYHGAVGENVMFPLHSVVRDSRFFFTPLLTYLRDAMMQVLGDSRLSRKYQITVPKDARTLLELDAGDMLIFVTENGELLIKRGRLQIEEWKQGDA